MVIEWQLTTYQQSLGVGVGMVMIYSETGLNLKAPQRIGTLFSRHSTPWFWRVSCAWCGAVEKLMSCWEGWKKGKEQGSHGSWQCSREASVSLQKKETKTKNHDPDRGRPNVFMHHLPPVGSSSDHPPGSTVHAHSTQYAWHSPKSEIMCTFGQMATVHVGKDKHSGRQLTVFKSIMLEVGVFFESHLPFAIMLMRFSPC